MKMNVKNKNDMKTWTHDQMFDYGYDASMLKKEASKKEKLPDVKLTLCQ